MRVAQQRCAKCGGELSVSWLEGRWRHACVGGSGAISPASASASASVSEALPPPPGSEGSAGCGAIAYTNPLLVVGAIITDFDPLSESGSSGGESGTSGSGGNGERRRPKVLLCKRNIEPRKGCWTLPAGYLELGESAAEGAARETWEEARARVEIFGPYFHAVRGRCTFFFFFFFFFLSSVGGRGREAQRGKTERARVPFSHATSQPGTIQRCLKQRKKKAERERECDSEFFFHFLFKAADFASLIFRQNFPLQFPNI